MSDDRKYVRVYYSILDDPKFEVVYRDDAQLALWLRLLLVADAMYPAPAPIPRSAKVTVLAKLAKVGLIEVLENGDRFRIHGLASERGIRSQYGRIGAASRWNGSRNASIDKHRQDKTSIDKQGATASFRDLVKDFPK